MEKNFKIVENDKKNIWAQNERFHVSSDHGKTREKIMCPFCSTYTYAFTWSLAGSGKKCDICIDTLHCQTGSIMRCKTEADALKAVGELNGE